MTARRAAAVALLLGLLVVVAGIVAGYDGEAGGQRSATGALSDYRDALYQPVRALARGVNPYDHEAYLATMDVDQELPPYFPLNYLPFAPLALLPLPVAGAVFVAASIAAVVATGALVAVTAGERGGRAVTVAMAFGAAVLASRVGFQALQYGQSGPWVALCLVLGVLGLRRGRAGLVAVAVAAAWAKPSLGLPVAALLALAAPRGATGAVLRRGVVRGTLVAWVTWIPVGLLLLRHDGPTDLVRIMIEDLRYSAGHPFGQLLSPSRIDVAASAAKLLGRRVPGAVELAIGLAVLGLTGWAARRTAEPARLLLLVVLGSLVGLWRQPYDLMLVLPLLAVLLVDRTADRSAGPGAVPIARSAGSEATVPAGAAHRRWAGDRSLLVVAVFLPAAFSWAFGQQGGELLRLGPVGAARLSVITGVSAAACWALCVLEARRSPVPAPT